MIGLNRYERWRSRYGEEYLRRLAESGLSEDEIAERVGLDRGVFQRWKKKYPLFNSALHLGSPNADLEVISALHKKATGYNVEVKKAYKLKRIDYDPETGKKVREYEEIAQVPDEDHVPADVRAGIFWLKNRQGDAWNDRTDRPAQDGGESEGGVVVIPAADRLGESDEE